MSHIDNEVGDARQKSPDSRTIHIFGQNCEVNRSPGNRSVEGEGNRENSETD